ncbi:2-keto-4-pentenoate hydratase, partial [Micromonospora sp. NPDC047074]
MSIDYEAAAQALVDARDNSTPCPPLRGRLLPEGDVTSAYVVQQLQVRQWLQRGHRRVGAKIGLTSRAVQENFGVFQPDFGVLLDDMAVPDGAEVVMDRLLQPRVEAEVAFVLGADLPDERITSADVIRAVDHLLPAIEIVDSRVAGWDISIVDTVADNA